jgi:hypothetical protein
LEKESEKKIKNKKKRSEEELGVIIEDKLKDIIESPCPVCNEYLEHKRTQEKIECSSCKLVCKMVKLGMLY